MRIDWDDIGDWCGIVGLILMLIGVGLWIVAQILKLVMG